MNNITRREFTKKTGAIATLIGLGAIMSTTQKVYAEDNSYQTAGIRWDVPNNNNRINIGSETAYGSAALTPLAFVHENSTPLVQITKNAVAGFEQVDVHNFTTNNGSTGVMTTILSIYFYEAQAPTCVPRVHAMIRRTVKVEITNGGNVWRGQAFDIRQRTHRCIDNVRKYHEKRRKSGPMKIKKVPTGEPYAEGGSEWVVEVQEDNGYFGYESGSTPAVESGNEPTANIPSGHHIGQPNMAPRIRPQNDNVDDYPIITRPAIGSLSYSLECCVATVTGESDFPLEPNWPLCSWSDETAETESEYS